MKGLFLDADSQAEEMGSWLTTMGYPCPQIKQWEMDSRGRRQWRKLESSCRRIRCRKRGRAEAGERWLEDAVDGAGGLKD